jgi:lysophospholipase L1-like esterase
LSALSIRYERRAAVLAPMLLLAWLGCGNPAAPPGSDAGPASGGVGGRGMATGGTLAGGGVPGSGGAGATGGWSGASTGGATTSGRATSRGGAGGTAGQGGATASGGTRSTGGAAGTGGARATGGAATGGAGAGTGGTTTVPLPDASPDLSQRDASPHVGTDATYPVAAGKPTVYLAGDSTVQTYSASQAPQQGWGQRIAELFTTDVAFVNKSIGGRSSKSFIDEGRLTEIIGLLKEGDYLFAQWGINDRYRSDTARYTDPATTFRTYLKQYIDGARGKKAIPVLVTPTPRLDYTDGVFHNGFVDYCNAIKAVGLETNTPVIDLQTMGLAYYTSIGYQQVVDTVCLAGPDVLHFRDTGAYQMARMVAQGVSDINLPISKLVRADKL